MNSTTLTTPVSSDSLDFFEFDAAEATPAFIVSAFRKWLASYIGDGAVIADGQTLQYGYSLLTCAVDSRTLRLLAPDFSSMPIQWQPDLSGVFSIVADHKYVPDSFGLEPEIPTLRETAIVGRRFDECPMFANRSAPTEHNPNDSGWFFGSTSGDVDNNDPSQLRVITLYEAMISVPFVTAYLSLPIGYQVMFDDNGPIVLRDFQELTVPPDSYLGRTQRNG